MNITRRRRKIVNVDEFFLTTQRQRGLEFAHTIYLLLRRSFLEINRADCRLDPRTFSHIQVIASHVYRGVKPYTIWL